MGDWIFAFFHFFLVIGIFLYGIYSLFQGNTSRFILIMGGLAVYYFLVLHKALKKEIERRRNQ
jgi:hypothetical protein